MSSTSVPSAWDFDCCKSPVLRYFERTLVVTTVNSVYAFDIGRGYTNVRAIQGATVLRGLGTTTTGLPNQVYTAWREQDDLGVSLRLLIGAFVIGCPFTFSVNSGRLGVPVPITTSPVLGVHWAERH